MSPTRPRPMRPISLPYPSPPSSPSSSPVFASSNDEDLEQRLADLRVYQRFPEDSSNPSVGIASSQPCSGYRSDSLYSIDSRLTGTGQCDIQGIDWNAVGLNRERTLYNHKFKLRSERRSYWPLQPPEPLPTTEPIFRHKRTWRVPVENAHLQFKHGLSALSRADIYFISPRAVQHRDPYLGSTSLTSHEVVHLNPFSGTARSVLDPLQCIPNDDGAFDIRPHEPTIRITALAAYSDVSTAVLVTASFQGEFSILDLSSPPGTPPTCGRLAAHPRPNIDASTLLLPNGRNPSRVNVELYLQSTLCNRNMANHVSLALSRSSSAPVAAVAVNDGRLQLLDTVSATVVKELHCRGPINCSVLSPDRRCRLICGDDFGCPDLIDADSGTLLASPGVGDTADTHGCSPDINTCAWMPGGTAVATAYADGRVLIHDARRWDRPIARFGTAVTAAAALTFAPPGTGPPALCVAERDYVVSVVDARTWASRQEVLFYGACVGAAFEEVEGGLVVGVGQQDYGGIMEFERSVTGRGGIDDENDWEKVELRPSFGDLLI